jgi:nucleoside-diphosphate-sugar epimerase
MINLAAIMKPSRYNHFSTSFIAGGYHGTIMENEMPPRETLNPYEDTKYQSELNLRAQSEVPFTILRPSIIVGNRLDGKIRSFKNFYLIIKYFAKMSKKKKTMPRFPNIEEMNINLVPLDFVVDASLAIGKLPSTGKTYNIVNDSPPNIGTVVKAIEVVTGVKVMEANTGNNDSCVEAGLVEARFKEFMPYFFGSPGYEMTSMKEALGTLENSTLPMESLEKIISFFIENE